MPSLVNTLRRCHSTVRGLRKSRAPISGFDSPSRASRAICASCGGELVARLDRALAHLLAGGQQLARGRARRTPPCRSRRTCRGRCAAARARRPAGSRGAATRRRAGARGRAPDAAACGPAARSPRGRGARRPRPRSAAPASAPRCRAPSRCRLRAVRLRRAARARSRASSASPARVGRLDQLGQRPHGRRTARACRRWPAGPPRAPPRSGRGR